MLDVSAFAHWTPPPAPIAELVSDRDTETTAIDLAPTDPSGDLSEGPPDVDRSAPAPEADDGDALTMAVGDFAILASPTISLPAFGAVLRGAKSPAASEYIGIYNAAVSYGVDPSVLLAVFQHESNFGKAGVAVATKSIGNLRFTAGSASVGATKYTTAHNGSFAAYTSYTQAATDASRLLASSLYGQSKGYSTVRTFPFRWAPAADHNAPAKYGASLAANIARWTGKAGSPFKAPPATPHPAKVAMTAAVHSASAAVAKAPAKIATAGSALGTGGTVASLPRAYLYAALAAGGIVLVIVVLAAMRKGRGRSSGGDE